MRFQTVADIRCEDGISLKIGQIVGDLFGTRSVLLVTDPGIIAAGLTTGVIKSLEDAGHSVSVFSDVGADPRVDQVEQGRTAALECKADLIVGFGGGSAMDVAKLIAYLAPSGASLDDCYGVDQITPNATCNRLPLVQVPTTSGTGSEVTNISVITTGATTKKGVVDPILYADLALLDATLTLTLPRGQTAATAIDAMVHAIEAFTSKRLKNAKSDALAKEALKMIGPSLIAVMENADDLAARRKILQGANLAGQAFTNAPVGAVHALAYPIGGHFHVPHGLSNSLVLPHVLAHNIRKGGAGVAALYGNLGNSLGFNGGAIGFVDWMKDLTAATGIETRLQQVGIAEGQIELLASDAMLQERLLVNNPVDVPENEARAIYEAAW